MQRRPERQLAALQPELDPDGIHGTQKLWAALKYVGLEPEDLAADFAHKGVGLHEKVPKAKGPEILQQRKEIREGLRQQRLDQVREALQIISDEDVWRLERTGNGVRILGDDDVPPMEQVDGMEEFMEQQRLAMERVQKDQERKANSICTDFLLGKKRAEEADAKIKELDLRLKEAKKEQEAKFKEKRVALQKAEEKRQAGASKAAEELEEYQNDLEEKAAAKLRNARARRAQTYSTENLKAKLDASHAKREAAFNAAAEMQAATLARNEERMAAADERLYQRRVALAEELEQRRQTAHAKFIEKQVTVAAMQQEWAENKLKEHKEFASKFKERRDLGKAALKERSKSVGDVTRKAMDKWRNTYERMQSETGTRNEEIKEIHRAAEHRVENELKPMRLKCGGDVFSHLEVKEKTFGDLVARRQRELQKARDAKTMALVMKHAERAAKDAAKEASAEEVRKKRVEASKKMLAYQNSATEVFLKIQCEPNEDRIRSALGGLGFKMPKINGEEEEEGAAS
mmetsp:Transcript_29952/g.75475  ORF Transcript_29952/g.75475 Transcript_29952/m.75475 type:complete len:517 (-) Transcript_29952:62-1612(-)